MKACLACSSTTFDDMDICYGCMQPFGDVPGAALGVALGAMPDVASAKDLVATADLASTSVLDIASDAALPAAAEVKSTATPPPLLAAFQDPSLVILPAVGGCGSIPQNIEAALDATFMEPEPFVEEPAANLSLKGVQSVRFHIAVSQLFGYDIYLQKIEGAELTIGCARDNDIVLPHTESSRHHLRLLYSQKQLWAEGKRVKRKAELDGVPFTGTRGLNKGSIIGIGGATIEVINT